MSKNHKGKEIGKEISQRKDGSYCARFVNKRGKRQERCFSTLPEARNWLEEVHCQDKHGKPVTSPDMTVDEWFEFWQAELLQGLSPNTKRNYRDRYEHNIKLVMGNTRLTDVKPMHCKIVLNHMIDSHPVDGVRYTKTGKSGRSPSTKPRNPGRARQEQQL